MRNNSSPAIDAAAWRDWLRAALRHEVPAERCLPSRDQPPAEIARWPAAVLLGITASAAPEIYLTERGSQLTHHPGQISFPGGRVDASDADAGAAALREAHEEIGLDTARVELLGALPDYRTVSGFDIRPFVGWVTPAAPLAPDGVEVARLFSVPLAYALDPAHYRVSRREFAGRAYRIYALDYGDDHIWGATAGILVGLAQRMALARGWAFELPPEETCDAGR